MRTFGQAILFLIFLVGLFLIVVSVVRFVWASEPDSFGFNGWFTEAGVICLLIGLGLVVAAIFLRRPPTERMRLRRLDLEQPDERRLVLRLDS